MALGAQRPEILFVIMRRATILVALGVAFGLIGALALHRVLSSALTGFAGLDFATCAAVGLLLGAVSLVASYLPARKALRVDPMQVLRCE
jgi:putative ABC transport system permease protein